MNILGRALARLATEIGGQVMLELPDDLPTSFAASLVNGANTERHGTPSFALFVHNLREDAGAIPNAVDFRELAMYRQGSRLAVTFASENRGMSTYSSVYPLLFSGGFPSASALAAQKGVASLADFTRCVAAAIRAQERDDEPIFDGFEASVAHIAHFLSEAYDVVGSGQASSSSDWWLHISNWAEGTARFVSAGDPLTTAKLFGLAGLPVPSEGGRLSLTARRYVSALLSRWETPAKIAAEVTRLEGRESSIGASKALSAVDWERSFDRSSLRSDSPIARVASCADEDAQAHADGWALLDERDFDIVSDETPGAMRFQRDGVDLPVAWRDAAPLLRVVSADVDPEAGEGALRVRAFSLVLPFRDGAPDEQARLALSAIKGGIRLRGLRGTTARFTPAEVEISDDLVYVRGDLYVTAPRKTPGQAWLEASVHGVTGSHFADSFEGTIAIVRDHEAALWLRPHGKATARDARGPVMWSLSGGTPSIIRLGAARAHDIFVALGSELASGDEALKLSGAYADNSWVEQSGLHSQASVPVTEDLTVSVNGIVAFRIEPAQAKGRPISPFAAAAHGVPPDATRLHVAGTLGSMEQMFHTVLENLDSNPALGCIVASNSNEFELLDESGAGIWCARDLKRRTGDLTPTLPSTELIEHPTYAALRDAYRSLRLPELLKEVERREDSDELTISRLDLGMVNGADIDRVLVAYTKLLEYSKSCSPSDLFWARNPFSVAVFRHGIGLQSILAVLLSPLHPIRLGWAWAVQVGLREAFDDGAGPASSLALLDGTYFPASCVVEDTFGQPVALMPIPIDPHPADVYLGWHASVSISNNSAEVPRWIAGRRFPVNGLSSISAPSVGSAIDDFLRVSPHVQSLRLALASASPAQRATSIDDGVLTKISELASRSIALDGVAGVRVTDSTNRLGSPPDLRNIQDVFQGARPGFNVEWVNGTAAEAHGNHVTILEGSAAQVAMSATPLPPTAALSSLPLRRIPRRDRHSNFVLLHYSLAPASAVASLPRAIVDYEVGSQGTTFALRVIPNLAGIPGRPQWLVAGDFGVDPQTLASAAANQSDDRYVLWDWRPVTTIRSGSSDGVRAQPYFVIAAVPKTLNNAIRDRLHRLNSSLNPEGAELRVRRLIATLASRAVGLNTLLAIGHHQATGALGFYFALRSLERWTLSAPDGELRMVIPVDAVDPFLRETALAAGDGTRRRADLLALRATLGPEGEASVVLVPIEIKHYGLTSDETDPAFPGAGEGRLSEHVEQLQSYQVQLSEFCELHGAATGGRASIIGQRLAAVVDAALQLRVGERHALDSLVEGKIVSAIAAGSARLQMGWGVLLWYQPGARTFDGASTSCEEVSGTVQTRRMDVRVDPKAFDACYWGDADGAAHDVVRTALARASDTAGDEPDSLIANSEAFAEGASQPRAQDATIALAATESGVPAAPKIVVALPNVGISSPPRRAEIPVTAPQSHAMLSHSTLEKRYGSLLAALSEFSVKVVRPSGVAPYREGPAFIEYSVSPAYGVSVSRVEAQLENLKLRLKLPADAIIGCSTHLGNILLTVPKADSERYFVDSVEMWARWERPEGKFAVPLGEDVSGNIVQIDFASSNSPHLLIAGVTGSGKSEALLTILHGAAKYYGPAELQMHLVDPKQTELTSLESLPHVNGPVGWTSTDAITLLDNAVEEMEARYDLFRRAGASVRSVVDYRATGAEMARWMIVLDEYADLVSDDVERKKIEKGLQRLSQKARAAGIHVIVSTQKPVVQVVNTVVKGNLPGRIALRVNTAMESRVILDEVGAELLVGKGDAIVKAGNARARVQFARHAI